MNIEAYIQSLSVGIEDKGNVSESEDSLRAVLKGLAIELWSDSQGRLWLVADEADAAKLGEPRGTVYTAAEARHVVTIADPGTGAEVHRWKRAFDGRVHDILPTKKAKAGGLE